MFRRLTSVIVAMAASLLCSFAAFSQTSPAGKDPTAPGLPRYVLDAKATIRTPVEVSRCWCFCAHAYPECARLDCGNQGVLRVPLTNSFKPSNEIQVIDLEGLKKLLQRDPKDTRPLLVNFWATWCDPCREEFPDLVKIDAHYGAKNLNFVAISLDDVTDISTAVAKFLKEMKATMPVVLLNVSDPEPAIKAVDATWDGQLPATYLYDQQGKIVFRHFGRIKPDELRAAIDKLVVSKP